MLIIPHPHRGLQRQVQDGLFISYCVSAITSYSGTIFPSQQAGYLSLFVIVVRGLRRYKSLSCPFAWYRNTKTYSVGTWLILHKQSTSHVLRIEPKHNQKSKEASQKLTTTI